MATYTAIPQNNYTADADVLATVAANVVGNIESTHDRALRGGTHGTGKRIAVARGVASGSVTSDDGVEVVFATDSLDGDPRFLATPGSIVLTLLEVGSGWTVPSALWCEVNTRTGFFGGGSQPPSATGFWICVRRRGAGGSMSFSVYWRARGLVTAGE